MGLKETYQEKLEAQLREWEAGISDFRSRADKVAADARVKYHEEIEALRAKYEGAQKRLEELKQAGGGAWEELRTGIEKAWEELKQAVESALTRFKASDGEQWAREEEIRRLAHSIWQEEGRPEGRASEHWSRAEALWEEEHSQRPSEAQGEAIVQPPASRKKGAARKRRTREKK